MLVGLKRLVWQWGEFHMSDCVDSVRVSACLTRIQHLLGSQERHEKKAMCKNTWICNVCTFLYDEKTKREAFRVRLLLVKPVWTRSTALQTLHHHTSLWCFWNVQCCALLGSGGCGVCLCVYIVACACVCYAHLCVCVCVCTSARPWTCARVCVHVRVFARVYLCASLPTSSILSQAPERNKGFSP